MGEKNTAQSWTAQDVEMAIKWLIRSAVTGRIDQQPECIKDFVSEIHACTQK